MMTFYLVVDTNVIVSSLPEVKIVVLGNDAGFNRYSTYSEMTAKFADKVEHYKTANNYNVVYVPLYLD